MVIAIRSVKQSGAANTKNSPPVLRYTRNETLTGVLGVKSNVFGVRRRLVRLERGILSIYAKSDECGEALATTRLCEAQSITVNKSKAMIQIRTTAKFGITLVFKHDISLLQLWAAALNRAHRAKLENFYKSCGEIGHGHYARVFEGFDRRIGDKVAIKIIPKNNKDPRVRQYAKREGEIVRMVNHPNVVKTIDVFETSTHLYVVMEHVSGGNLLEFLAGGKNRVNEKNALRIAGQLLDAVAYLHSNDVIHRDIKAENILVGRDGTIKVADFGLARRLDGVASDEYCLSSVLGTPAYCSPEVVTRSHYGKPVDLFGCGVLLFVALSGALPFRGDTPDKVFSNIAKGNISFPKARWALISKEARDFVQQLLSHRADDRPTASQALQHKWLSSNGDRVGGKRPISPRPFVRNASDRASTPTTNPARMPRVTSTSSFRRAQSGSLQDLIDHKIRRGATPTAA